MNKISSDDGKVIERQGFAAAPIQTKLKVVKDLLEAQFDENVKFKQTLAEQSVSDAVRSQPTGRDLQHNDYWLFLDKEFVLRLFLHSNDTWKLIGKEMKELKELIEKLSSEPALVKLRNSKRYLKKMKVAEEKKSIENKVDEINKEEPKNDVKIEVKIEEAKVEKEEVKLEDVKIEEVKLEEVKVEETKEEKKDLGENEEKSEEKEIQPIALRKSSRASVKKAQEIIQLQLNSINVPKTTPKKPSTPSKGRKKAADNSDSDKEDAADDEEFKPKLTTKTSDETKKSKKGSPKKKLKVESDVESDVETTCIKCNKVKPKQIVRPVKIIVFFLLNFYHKKD